MCVCSCGGGWRITSEAEGIELAYSLRIEAWDVGGAKKKKPWESKKRASGTAWREEGGGGLSGNSMQGVAGTTQSLILSEM